MNLRTCFVFVLGFHNVQNVGLSFDFARLRKK